MCLGTGPPFFSLSPLCRSSSFRLLFSRLVYPYPQVRRGHPDRPPGRRGGVERSLEGTPRPARGDGGMWRVGWGREPWERSEAGGFNDNERHLHHSPVLRPTEELRKDKRKSDDSERRERTRKEVLVCVRQSSVRGCRFYFILLLKSCKCSLVSASFFPIYELCYTSI